MVFSHNMNILPHQPHLRPKNNIFLTPRELGRTLAFVQMQTVICSYLGKYEYKCRGKYRHTLTATYLPTQNLPFLLDSMLPDNQVNV